MKKLVVIGGGFIGSLVAKELESEFDVTLIDRKDYFEFTPSVLRVLVNPKLMKKIQVLHKNYLRHSKIICGKVEKISGKSVRVNGKEIKFDYLVVASGSHYNIPFKGDFVSVQRAKSLKKEHDDLEKAKNILIIGGGLVGIELAGEITDRYKDKKVNIIDANSGLIPRNNPKAGEHAEKFLRKKGVEFIFDEKVSGIKGKTITTNKKRNAKFDLIFLCTGIKPNSDFIKKSSPKSLDKNNFAEVNEFLQLKGFENIFAGGDVTTIKEEKTAQNAQNHAVVIMKNIRNLDKKRKLAKYKKDDRMYVISLGRFNGIILYKKFTLTGILPALMKKAIEVREMFRYR